MTSVARYARFLSHTRTPVTDSIAMTMPVMRMAILERGAGAITGNFSARNAHLRGQRLVASQRACADPGTAP